MSDSEHRVWFERSASSWLCDGYSIDVKFVAARHDDGSWVLQGGALNLYPGLPTSRISLDQTTAGIRSCFFQIVDQPRTAVLRLLEEAMAGRIEAFGESFRFAHQKQLDYYSDSVSRDRWYWTLDLRILGPVSQPMLATALATAEAELRRATVPFDGLQDLLVGLGLADALAAQRQAEISVSMLPPVDLIYEESSLNNEEINLTFFAHPKFDRGRLSVGIRWLPGNDTSNRFQAADKILWSVSEDSCKGVLRMNLPKAASFLTMLTLDETVIRRQWFNDFEKSPNESFVAMSHSDRDLRMLKKGLFETTDSAGFEKAVAAALFLLGFAPAQPLENDAPDIILATPSGRIVIFECTIKLADVSAKLGKLVDRRANLQRALQQSSHPFPVTAVLVCRQRRDQLTQAKEIERNHVALLCLDQMEAGIHRLQFRNNPDALIDEMLADLMAGQRVEA